MIKQRKVCAVDLVEKLQQLEDCKATVLYILPCLIIDGSVMYYGIIYKDVETKGFQLLGREKV